MTNVQFTDLSTGNPTSWVWKRNGVQFSILQNPSASFTSPGVYAIQLTASNTSGSGSISKNVTVFANPSSNFVATGSTSGCLPHTVSFSDQSTSGNSSISSWLWSFGDGGQSSAVNPNHTYTLSGNFPVSLKVVDGNGCEDTKQIGNYITVYPLPSAQFSSNGTRITCAPPLTVVFTNTSTGNGTLTYSWDFGDASGSTAAAPSHTYTGFGQFDVKLRVTDGNGCVDSLILQDYIRIQPISADFTVSSDSVCLGDSLVFSDNSSGALSRNWNFGDGNTGSGLQVAHTFTDSGWFNVRLIASVSAAGCADTIYKQVYVQQVVADFSVSDPYICQYPGKQVQYTNESVNSDFHAWYRGIRCPYVPFFFPCGIPSQNPSALYHANMRSDIEGVWPDTLVVWSKLGCYDTVVHDTSVIVNFARAGVELSPMAGCRPFDIDLLGHPTPYNTSIPTVNPAPTITSMTWLIEDTFYSNNINPPDLPIVDTGFWQGKYIIENSLGCRDTAVFNYEAGDSVIADFYMLHDTVCVGEFDTAISLSQDTTYINQYNWNIAGGDLINAGRKGYFTSKTIGHKGVQLVVGHHGCTDTLKINNAIYFSGPVVNIGYNLFDCFDSTKIAFQGNMQDANTWTWDFGDPSLPDDSVNMNPIVTYPSTGLYNVKLTAFNADSSCKFEDQEPVRVNRFNAFIRTDTEVPLDTNYQSYGFSNGAEVIGCAPFTVHFNSFTSSGFHGNWIIDSFAVNGVPHDSIMTFTFNKRGIYDIKLYSVDTNLNCVDSTSCEIHVFDPVADFYGNPNVGCTPLTANLISNATTTSSIVKYYWTVGSIIDSTQNFGHTFNTDVDLDATLTVIDEHGCTDTRVKKHYVQSSSFDIYLVAASLREMCSGDSIQFFQTLSLNDVAYTWIFGDGDTSYQEEPYHTYLDSGTFDVTLIARDSVGCVKTQVRPGYVKVQLTPDAEFWADKTDSTCYPLPVQFYADTNIVYYNQNSYLYSLGDFQAASNYKDPFYNYVRPGGYTVTLKVTTTYGCTDTETKIHYINVGGPYGEIEFFPDSICRGDSVTYTMVNPINANDFGWDFGDGVVVLNANPVTHQYTDSVGHIYPNLFFTDSAGGCPKTFEDTVYIFETVADFGYSDSIGCVSFNPSLTNKSTMSNWWRWDFGDGASAEVRNPNKTYNYPGEYIVELNVRNSIGCVDTFRQKFYVYPLPDALAESDTLICEGDTIQLFAAGGELYYWLPDNQGILNPNIHDPLATPRNSILYNVQVTDTNGCQDQAGVNVLVQNPIVLELDDPLVMIVGEKLKLIKARDPSGLIYKWEPSTGLDCDTCTSPTLTALESGSYMVTVTDSNGCFETVSSFYLEVRNEYTLDVPQAFTPNGDGVNDVIFADGWGILDLRTFQIYNRWGEKLFESSDMEIGWDGTYKGKEMEMDAYVYYVEGLTYGNTVLRKKGEFTLIR